MPKTEFASLLELERDDYARLRLLGEAGYLWLYRGDHDQALVIFEALIDLAPGDPTGYSGSAEVHLAKGAARPAAEAARKARRARNADNRALAFAHLLEAKAHLMAKKGDEAKKALAKALEVDPGGDVGETARELGQLLDLKNTGGPPGTDPPPSIPPDRGEVVP